MKARASLIVGFLGGVLLAFIVAAWVVVRGVPWTTGERTIDVSRPSIVRQVQQLERLETVVFGMDKIISGGYESAYLPKFLAGDRLLLLAYGDVTAGVDLSRLDPESGVAVDGTSVQIALPAAEIFTVRIDNERTRVYSRETGLFSSVDPHLESEVRREAERQVRQAAIDAGILQTADSNARATLTAFLRGLGFETIDVR